MDETILKDVFISMNELERYFEGLVPVNLWRGLNIKRSTGLFDLIETPFIMSNGKVRKPDITIVKGWVKVNHWPVAFLPLISRVYRMVKIGCIT